MPAQPPEGPSPATPEKYFEGGAALYDQSRPTYPKALISRIAEAIPGRDVLDVGCGSGIEARQFQAAGCTVLGVDPDAHLAGYAATTGVPTEVATFESWDAAGRQFDAVVAGTAWHWVDPVAGAVKAAEVLRPGGLLAPFHHASLTPPELADPAGMALPGWTTRSAAAYQRSAPDSPFDRDGQRISPVGLYQPMFDMIAEGIRQAGSFSKPELWRFTWEQAYSKAEWLSLLPTQGSLAKLPPDELARILAAVGAVIDRLGGSFTLPYATIAVTAIRTG
ncbi:MAG: class I SAM-dependent methyltransferase [Jatrophihabitantaceae bacterium]